MKLAMFLKKPIFFTDRMLAYSLYISEQTVKSKNILDVGSGHGFISSECAKVGCRVISIDISASSLKKQKCYGLDRVCADACHLPLKETCVDLVLAISLLEHIFEPERALNEFKEVMENGGTLVVQLPNMQYLIEPHTMVPLFFILPSHIKEYFVKNLGYYTDVNLSFKRFMKLTDSYFNVINTKKIYHKVKTGPWPAGWMFFLKKK